MADLILHDTEYETDSNESYRFDFDPTDSETLERIEAVFAAGKAQSGEGRELLSRLCASSLERASTNAGKNNMSFRLKNVLGSLKIAKKEIHTRIQRLKNRQRIILPGRRMANRTNVQISFGSCSGS